MKTRMIFGFHAVTARLRHDASTIEEIYVDASRHDRRMGDLLRAAKGANVRIIQADDTARREEVASKMGFSAYGITDSDDPLSQAMKGLIDNASSQEHQIALLWQAIEKLSAAQRTGDCVPLDAARKESFEADKLNQLMGK